MIKTTVHGFGTAFKKSVLLNTQRQSTKLAQQHTPVVVASMKERYNLWRMLIRQLLAMRRTTGLNRTKWPKRRTGALYYSVGEARISIRKAARKNQISIKLYPHHGKAWNSYGAILNSWQDKPFGGWQDRANQMLIETLRERM